MAQTPVRGNPFPETSNWLLERGAGLILGEPMERNLTEFFGKLSHTDYAELVNRVAAVPRDDLVIKRANCQAFVEELQRPIRRGVTA